MTSTAKNDLIQSRTDEYCEGCTAIVGRDGYESWTPAEACPVHGADSAVFWANLNDELRRLGLIPRVGGE